MRQVTLRQGSLPSAAILFLGSVVGLAAARAAAGPSTAREIIERSEQRTKAATESSVYTMELIDPNGKVEQTRRLEVHFKRYPDREVTLQKFLAPPVLEDSGMMIVDTGAATNDIWMYLPATRRLRRISGAEKSNWYMGTQFTYEDFEDYRIHAYAFTLLGDATDEDGARCWRIEAVAQADAEKKASGYGRKVYWIEQESLYPVRVDYFDQAGREVKRLTTAGLGRHGKYFRPKETTMTDLRSGRRTRVVALERALDQPLDDFLVSNRYLRKD